MELLLAVLVVTFMCATVPAALVDAYVSAKAAAAGRWDVAQQGRTRPTFWQRLGTAWGTRRAARNRQAGGDGDYRPGARAYAQDVYRGFWEQALQRRRAKAAHRGPYVYDPDAPTLAQRVDAAVLAKVAELRQAWQGHQAAADVPAADVEPAAEQPPPPVGSVRFTDTDRERWDGTTWQPLPQPAADPQPGGAEPADIPEQRFTSTPQPGEQPVPAIQPEGETMTQPTPASGVGTDVADVQTNEAARRSFQAMRDAAAEAADALAALEAAKAKLSQAAQALSDGVNATRFDATATSAANHAADVISATSLTEMAGAIDAVAGAAQQGHQSLEKYRDSEDQVAGEQIDARVLEPTAS